MDIDPSWGAIKAEKHWKYIEDIVKIKPFEITLTFILSIYWLMVLIYHTKLYHII